MEGAVLKIAQNKLNFKGLWMIYIKVHTSQICSQDRIQVCSIFNLVNWPPWVQNETEKTLSINKLKLLNFLVNFIYHFSIKPVLIDKLTILGWEREAILRWETGNKKPRLTYFIENYNVGEVKLKCIYSYFFKTHDFLQSILDILAANKHFFKD